MKVGKKTYTKAKIGMTKKRAKLAISCWGRDRLVRNLPNRFAGLVELALLVIPVNEVDVRLLFVRGPDILFGIPVFLCD